MSFTIIRSHSQTNRAISSIPSIVVPTITSSSASSVCAVELKNKNFAVNADDETGRDQVAETANETITPVQTASGGSSMLYQLEAKDAEVEHEVVSLKKPYIGKPLRRPVIFIAAGTSSPASQNKPKHLTEVVAQPQEQKSHPDTSLSLNSSAEPHAMDLDLKNNQACTPDTCNPLIKHEATKVLGNPSSLRTLEIAPSKEIGADLQRFEEPENKILEEVEAVLPHLWGIEKVESLLPHLRGTEKVEAVLPHLREVEKVEPVLPHLGGLETAESVLPHLRGLEKVADGSKSKSASVEQPLKRFRFVTTFTTGADGSIEIIEKAPVQLKATIEEDTPRKSWSLEDRSEKKERSPPLAKATSMSNRGRTWTPNVHDGQVVGIGAKPLDAMSKGRKMMEGMGWVSGKGLGSQEQGLVDHIASVIKSSNAGLGAAHIPPKHDSSGWAKATKRAISDPEVESGPLEIIDSSLSTCKHYSSIH